MDGMKIGFYAGDHLKLSEDMQVLKPTLFPSVPRLFNRIYDKIKKGVAE
jgi:long-chain acyl-CoA synthetase